MTEQHIITMLQHKKSYEAEVAILRDCSDEFHEIHEDETSSRYALLNRRITLINHWLDYLSPEERFVIDMHLVQRRSWTHISQELDRLYHNDVACDERTLQRLQAKVIKKIASLMNDKFGTSMDYLIEEITQSL